MNIAPPRVLRIKRKRGQDPLQALILEDKRSVKRSKPSTPVSSRVPSPVNTPPAINETESTKNFYFTLSRTDDMGIVDDSVVQSILAEAPGAIDPEQQVHTTRKRKFVIPKNQSEEDTIIPNELSDMLNSFLSVGDENSSQRKRKVRGGSRVESTDDKVNTDPVNLETPEIQVVDPAVSEYVYDVYLLTSTEPLTTANHPQSQIGYIRFFDDDDNNLYQSDDDDTGKPPILSDDEDSNAEDFYQNDYPSDEDAGVFSESNSVLNLDVDGNEDEDQDLEQLEADVIQALNEGDYDDYDDVNYLGDDQYFNEDDEDNSDDQQYTRNTFFESDKEDALAIHRDKIFGKLQSMIDEKD